jgi:thioredoxin-related protein
MKLRSLVASAAATALALGAAQAAEDIGYDPHADPAAALASGAARAAADGKLVLLIAGGDWCSWCHYLNAFIKSNADVERAIYETFVVVKVYYGDDNKNDAFFSQWPAAEGYPHFWVFSADGYLLRSQGTLPLEDGAKSYDKGAFLAFIDDWKRRG